jgi:hypothetical protein
VSPRDFLANGEELLNLIPNRHVEFRDLEGFQDLLAAPFLVSGHTPGTSSPMAPLAGPKQTVIKSSDDLLGEDKPWSTPLPQGISPGELKGTHAVHP